MKKAKNILLIILGILLLAAAIMKGWQLPTKSMANNEPAKTTGGYEVLEPTEWVGKKLPILKDIDIGDKLEKGNWLVLLYHHDCPDCVNAIAKFEQMANDLFANEEFLKIALIEVPPYGRSLVKNNSNYTIGKFSDIKEWFITTPAVVLLKNSIVRMAWEGKVPDFDTILQKNVSTKHLMSSPYGAKRGDSNGYAKGHKTLFTTKFLKQKVS